MGVSLLLNAIVVSCICIDVRKQKPFKFNGDALAVFEYVFKTYFHFILGFDVLGKRI